MELHFALLTIGGLLLVGLLTDEIGRRTRLPRVTLLILFGVLAGPPLFDLLPPEIHEWREFLVSIALTMVAFLLGGTLSASALRAHGRAIFAVSLSVALLTAFLVGLGLIVVGTSVLVALALAGVATSTDPAATQDVLRQLRAKGPFTDTLSGVVAIDDAWGLIVFSGLLIIAKASVGDGGVHVLAEGLAEFAISLAVGAAIGFPAAFLTGRLKSGEPVQAEALGVVFLCAGASIWLGGSFLVAGMTAGCIVANFAKHHRRAFHEIEHIEWPFLVLFFVLAGAALDLDALESFGVVGAVFLVLRLVGRVLGGWVGGALGGLQADHRRWIGVALVPQAGVALGMALVAGDEFPMFADQILSVAVSTTIFFEICGPVLTQLALRRVGENRDADRDDR